MRILIVTPTIPFPPNWGFGIRVYQIVRELSRNHCVSVLCYAHAGEEDKVAALRAVCHSVHTVPIPLATNRAKRWAQLLSLFGPRSFQATSVRSAEHQRTVTRLLGEEHFDLVQFESSQISFVQLPPAVPWVLDEHNIEYELLQRMYKTERSPLRKLHNMSEYLKFRREERRSWQHASACVMTSEREQLIVENHVPGQRTHVAPNGVDIDFFSPADDVVDPDEVVFTGLMSYRPNIDAVTFFVRQVLPLILQRRPNAHFSIVGLDPAPEVSRLDGPSVTVVGGVDDVRPYVRRAGVFVVPLRMGSGTRLKVLEGIAMGKGMVSTTLGCEGIDVVDEEHLLIADSAEAFAAASLSLMDDAALAQTLGRRGRMLVEQRYSWASIVRDLEAFHATIVNDRA